MLHFGLFLHDTTAAAAELLTTMTAYQATHCAAELEEHLNKAPFWDRVPEQRVPKWYSSRNFDRSLFRQPINGALNLQKTRYQLGSRVSAHMHDQA